MPQYVDSMRVKDARLAFFQHNRFGKNGGYNEPRFTVTLGCWQLSLPNSPARIRAVKYHDIHHILTDYKTCLRGEAENSAWELASGCGGHSTAWFLNLLPFAIGLMLAPSRLWRAFVRGRQSSNLYDDHLNDEILNETLGVLRDRLHLNRRRSPAALVDTALFGATALASLVVGAGVAAAIPFIALFYRMQSKAKA